MADREAADTPPDIAPDGGPKTPRLSNDESSDSDDDSKHEPLKRASFPLNRHKRQGYQHAPTTSYSDLANASMYSLNEHESIIDINGAGHDTDGNPEGWPVFGPLDGPYPFSVYKKDYKQLKNEILSGLVVSFAQVPEAVAFSFLAGVDPFIGLHAAWIVGFITSFFGGRCAEISGATGATAAVLAPYMSDPDVGVMYLPYIIILVGIIIMFWGIIGVSKMISLVPHPCMIGFVNGLAVIIASAQLGSFEELAAKHDKKAGAFYGELAWMIGLTLFTFVIVEYLPRITKVLPATLIAILSATFVEHIIIRMALNQETVLIGELGDFAGGLPKIPGIDDYWDLPPLNWSTFKKILLPSLTVALVSTVEDLLTIEVVHDLTNTRPKSVAKCELVTKMQIIAMGAANFVCGFMGAIGGGSTIGLSTVNCYAANGRYRWSGVTCSISTFFIVYIASPALTQVPASALVGLMMVVVVHTFEWSSIPIVVVTFLPLSARKWLSQIPSLGHRFKVHRKIRRADGLIILLVTILTILTNLGYAIIAGVLFATLMYTWDSAKALKHSSITIKRKKRNLDNSDPDSSPMANGEDTVNGDATANGYQQNTIPMHQMKKVVSASELNESADDTEDEGHDDDDGEYEKVKIYILEGPLMFSNANRLPSMFHWDTDPHLIEIHLQNCNVYDYTAMNQLNNIAAKYKAKGKVVHLKYINVQTRKAFDKANQLVQNFKYDVDVEVKDQSQFVSPIKLNIADVSKRQL